MKVKEESEKVAQHLENKDHSIWSHHFMANSWGNSGHSGRLYFGGLQNHCRWWLQPWKEKTLIPWKKSYEQPGEIFKSRDITLPTKICLVKAMLFPLVMYRCESWTTKKAECGRIDAFELWCWRRLLGVPWTARRSNQSILKEIGPGRTDAEAETPILWPPDAKSWLIGKDPNAGKDWGQEKGMTEDEMVGWHHRLNGRGFGWTLGVGDGQGGLVCCSSWGHKESDTTERLNWTELKIRVETFKKGHSLWLSNDDNWNRLIGH